MDEYTRAAIGIYDCLEHEGLLYCSDPDFSIQSLATIIKELHNSDPSLEAVAGALLDRLLPNLWFKENVVKTFVGILQRAFKK